MSSAYSENQLVQESSLKQLRDELGWDVQSGSNSETHGRGSLKGVLLTKYFRAALRNLNPELTESQILLAEEEFTRRLSSDSLLQTNAKKYALIRDGAPITITGEDGQAETRRVKIVDFATPENNYFLALSEFTVKGEAIEYTKRADIVGFVNGVPLLFIELKKHTVDVQAAYDGNYTDYQTTIPQLFYYNAFVILSNGIEAKLGALGSQYEFFHEWKRLAEQDVGSVALETMLRGVCAKENFLDLLENFILFDRSGGKLTKIIARNHQYLGVNQAVAAYGQRALNDGKLGVFWHTQGSGKSYSMAFLAQKIRRKFPGSPTIVILTDREELNKQISETFENCGLLGDAKGSQFSPANGEQLIQALKGNPSFLFTLIQKFNRSDVEPIYPKHDVLVISDEAHRSQYGIFAENMVKLLPTAARIGFTGTPLFAHDNITVRTFGEYVSVYDFKRAVEDGATVPLYYENRGEKLRDLENPEITQQILDAIDDADVDQNQQEKLEREFSKEIHLLTAEPRLRAIAQDFVRHYSDLWTSGKAMFVCLNKITCVRMYNYAQEYWAQEIATLEAKLKSGATQEDETLERKLEWMRQTEMAVVVSPDQNEIATFAKWNLDIRSHRVKMEKRELDKEFKDPENPFRVVFVCAMWLTGFDVKCLSCLYLDKPMKAHSLMQAIARANRVNEGKSNGLVVDYVGIVKALRKALADYTADLGKIDGIDPTIDKKELVDGILERIELIKKFLREHEFELDELVAAKDFAKLSLLQSGANAVCAPIEVKRAFTAQASELARLARYADREDLPEERRAECAAIAAIRAELGKKLQKTDITDLMVAINKIISANLAVESPSLASADQRRFDISKINFERLRSEFERVKNKKLAMRDLQELIEKKLEIMIAINPNRADFFTRYQKIIDDYNAEQDRATIEKTFHELMTLADSLTEEERRYLDEGFKSDDELTLYDMLFKEGLSKSEIQQLKTVATSLLAKIKTKIGELDHWFDKPETQAAVKNLIRNALWYETPERYFVDAKALNECRDKIYEFVCRRYREAV